ncbi:MAG TPA: nuclear transport factor 2 family protein [Novosphingobium sp.]|nr:nuclear transport factor 2 family protein [Novosphingobium sp.]
MTDFQSAAACRDFVVRCLRALDDRDYETLASGFAADGVWDRGGEQLVGPEAVRAAMAKRPDDFETQHLALNMVVDMEGAEAATVSYTIAAYAQTSDKPAHLHGLYRATDCLARSPEGWHFTKRSVSPAFPAQT